MTYDSWKTTDPREYEPYEEDQPTELDAAHDRVFKLEKALREIAAIENKDFGPDWEEIEEVRKIAKDALADLMGTVGERS